MPRLKVNPIPDVHTESARPARSTPQVQRGGIQGEKSVEMSTIKALLA